MRRDVRLTGPRSAVVAAICLFSAMAFESAARAEDSGEGIIHLEEITLDDAIQLPTVFSNVAASGDVAPSPPAKTSGGRQDVQRQYDVAFDRWSRAEELRLRAIEAARVRRDDIDALATAPAARTKRAAPPLLHELRSTRQDEEGGMPAITVIALRGSARDLGTVLEAAQQAGRGVEACMRSNTPELTGPLPLLLEVNSAGRVTYVRVVGPDHAADLGRCIEPILGALHFPAIEDPTIATYMVFYRLWVDPAAPIVEVAPVVEYDNDPGAPSPLADDPEPAGPFNSAIARRHIAAKLMNGLRACHTSALRDEPGLEGRVTVDYNIGRSGRVIDASPRDNRLPVDVGSCIVDRLRMLRFPPPEGGAITRSYTFTIHP